MILITRISQHLEAKEKRRVSKIVILKIWNASALRKNVNARRTGISVKKKSDTRKKIDNTL